MPYGNSKGVEQELNKMKNKLSQDRPDLNVDNMSQNDMKNMVIDEINKNPNIDPTVKDKISKGDIDGLKQDIIGYLSNNKSSDGTSDMLVNMLKNNDMDGLKNQLMGMLLGGMNPQKKNEINSNEVNDQVASNSASNSPNTFAGLSNLLGGLDSGGGGLLGMLMNKMNEGRPNDSRIALLHSMKPFLSDTRQKGIDNAVRIINMIGFFEQFKLR